MYYFFVLYFQLLLSLGGAQTNKKGRSARMHYGLLDAAVLLLAECCPLAAAQGTLRP